MTATRSRTRDQLLLSLVNALTDQPRASMGELAAMVGLSRATLCRYFPSRDDMMLALYDAALKHAEKAVAQARPHEGPPEAAIKRLIDELLPVAELYAYVEQQLQANQTVETPPTALRNALISLFQGWQACGALRSDLPAVFLLESLSSLLRSAAAMIRFGHLARLDAANCVYQLALHGMSSQKD